jgi:hypothetical protein
LEHFVRADVVHYRTEIHCDGEDAMKRILVAGLVVVTIGAIPTLASAGERIGDAAGGAVAGVLVGGPVGLVAGGVIGYTEGPTISRGLGFHHHYRHHHYRNRNYSHVSHHDAK